MLTAEEHPGIVTFLLGMIVLVMAAVGMSLLTDRIPSGSRKGFLLNEISTGEKEIIRLNAQLESGTKNLTATEASVAAAKKAAAAVEMDKGRITGLTTKRDKLTAALPKLEEDFTKYRSTYRQAARVAAVGQKLGDLSIRGGRVYHQAMITRVTDVGIEITHEGGIARIQAPDLDASFQDRFQWNEEERARRLKQELADHNSMSAPPSDPPTAEQPAPSGQPTPAPAPAPRPDQEKINSLRQQVLAWRSKVNTLGSQYSSAASQVQYGRQNSVPGSLETWSARAQRLQSELAQARVSLALAKSKLSELAPYDPALADDPH